MIEESISQACHMIMSHDRCQFHGMGGTLESIKSSNHYTPHYIFLLPISAWKNY